MSKGLNILVIGNGMYSTGRGTDGFGTILPAINEYRRSGNKVESLHIVGTRVQSSIQAKEKSEEFKLLAGSDISIKFSPTDEDEVDEFKKAINEIQKPACAIIAVPDHLHHEIAKTCLENNLHCLIVKPFTPKLSEARELTSLAEKKGLVAWVEFHKRWDRSNILLRDSYSSGELGELLYCIVEYSQRKSIPIDSFKEWSSQTNILNYLGVHYVDLVRFITRALPKRVSANGQEYFLKDKGINTYDAIECSIEWETIDKRSFIQTIFTNWIDPENSSAASDQKIKLIGTKGRIESDQKNRGVYLNTDDQSPQAINPYFCLPFKNDLNKLQWSGYGIESFEAFLSTVSSVISREILIKNIPDSRPTFKESIISTSVLEAAKDSLENNSEWVSL